jgi:hypothetical protein
MAHNSPNECINSAGYLSLQVLSTPLLLQHCSNSSCFNVSGPSLATNSSPGTKLVFFLRRNFLSDVWDSHNGAVVKACHTMYV